MTGCTSRNFCQYGSVIDLLDEYCETKTKHVLTSWYYRRLRLAQVPGTTEERSDLAWREIRSLRNKIHENAMKSDATYSSEKFRIVTISDRRAWDKCNPSPNGVERASACFMDSLTTSTK